MKCEWIYGEPKDGKTCGKPTHKDKPYCADHCRLAYRKTTKYGSRPYDPERD